MPIAGKCESCRFFDAHQPRNVVAGGQCRAHPPVFHPEAQDEQSGWPEVERLDWCGEWEKL